MLSRIANNLYWAGRYLERMEHVSRFVPVIYFSGLDGPEAISQQYTLQSINKMAGTLPENLELKQRDVLFNVAFDKSNTSSIISCAALVRENCRGARDILSTELWEAINKLFLYVQNYKQDDYLKTHMQAFLNKVMELVALCKAYINSTLIQNQTWSILSLGLQIERGIQITRIIAIKLEDIETLSVTENEAIKLYEYANMLKSLESYDMNRKYYKKAIDKCRSLEFLFFNRQFPRSLAFCVSRICEILAKLEMNEKGKKKSVKLISENLRTELRFLQIEDIQDEIQEYIRTWQSQLFLLNNILVSNYFGIS